MFGNILYIVNGQFTPISVVVFRLKKKSRITIGTSAAAGF